MIDYVALRLVLLVMKSNLHACLRRLLPPRRPWNVDETAARLRRGLDRRKRHSIDEVLANAHGTWSIVQSIQTKET
jgi:hypothetical protein